jgi:chromatin segregation and condensation protein Rec8/ScpA/Scc1 (kleisin family)
MDDCSALLSSSDREDEYLNLKEGSEVSKECSNLEKYFELREVKKDEIKEKRDKEKKEKLFDIGNVMDSFNTFSNFFHILRPYENDEEECEKINNVSEMMNDLYEKIGELTLKFADGDKELAKKYIR